jgi:hypothetical protein
MSAGGRILEHCPEHMIVCLNISRASGNPEMHDISPF